MFAGSSGKAGPSSAPPPLVPQNTADVPPTSNILDTSFPLLRNVPTTGATGVPIATSTPLASRRGDVGSQPVGPRTGIAPDRSFRSSILRSSMLDPPAPAPSQFQQSIPDTEPGVEPADQSELPAAMPGVEPASPPGSHSSRGTIHERPPPKPAVEWIPAFRPRVVVRADPAMVSCFSSADAELYKLWVQS